MADSVLLTLDAIDTLMFRDGRPFNQADDGASRAVSVFPPFPPTLVGAVRAAIWRGPLGGKWDNNKLGYGTNWPKDGLGALSFGPPLLFKGDEPVFPMPLHIAEGKKVGDKVETRTFLRPGSHPLQCDLGSARLPEPDGEFENLKPIEDRWVTLSGMRAILDGRLPENEQLVQRDELWKAEPRVGIGLAADTRTTGDGQLYMASHMRLTDDVRLGVTLAGLEEDIGDALLPLAGEHRMAEIKKAPQFDLPSPPKTLEGGRFCVILLSPLVLGAMPGPGCNLDGLPGTLVSACLGKPAPVGGWDSQAKQPIPLRQAVPAGSVWFMELGKGEAPDWRSSGIGVATEWGFGQYLIGKW